MEKEFGSYQGPELASVLLQKKERKGACPNYYEVLTQILAIQYHLLWWGFSSRGRHTPVPADKLEPCYKVKGPRVVYSGTDKPKIGFNFWIVVC